MHLRNLKSVASSPKQPCDPYHAFFGGKFYTLGVGLAVVDPLVNFKQRSLIYSRNIEGGSKFQKRSRDQDHAPFGGKYFTLGWDLP